MSKNKKAATSQQDGIQYRRAKTWHIALSQLSGATTMAFYALMSYATYIGNSNFGILVGVTGIIITASRVFDGVTDPICAFVVERFNSKFGKIRIFMVAGVAVMSLATTLMCNIGAGKLDGIGGLLFFIVCYLIYIIGYTLHGVSTSMAGNIMTNDPRQRPTISVWSTVYSYLTPTITMMIGMMAILPRHDNIIGTSFLAEYNLVIIAISIVFCLLVCIGISPYDRPENFEGVKAGKSADQKPSLKDMWELIKENRELQNYMIAACSDKLAQTIGGAAVVSTMLYGILIGNISISSTLSAVTMLPSILFAIVGAKLAGKHGNKKVMVDWTWICIGLNVVFGLYLLFCDTTKITVSVVPTVIFLALTLGNGAVKMVVSTATGALRMDVVDYEMYLTGRYMPATVSATYSFVDKLISSFGATIATFAIGLIGYTATTPQQGDPLTWGVRIMTVLLYCGFPIIGWICTVVIMKRSELSREKMVEVQKEIAQKKAAADKTVA